MTNKNEQILQKINDQKLAASLKNLEEIVDAKINKITAEKKKLEEKIKKLEEINHNYKSSQNSIKRDLEKIKNIIGRK